MKQHVHVNEIKAWADGEKIEGFNHEGWVILDKPAWLEDNKYRIYDVNREAKEAFQRGEKIECRDIGKQVWLEAETPLWLSYKEYRVKPKPEYVPYSWEDRADLIGKGYVCEEEGFYSLVVSVRENRVNNYTFAEAFEKLTHLDGTPFGKLKTK